MAKKLFDEKPPEPISPLIDVAMNAFGAMFIILMIYLAVARPAKETPLEFITGIQPPPAIIGQKYAFTFPVVGAVGLRTFRSQDADLELWNLNLDTNSGTIYGVPKEPANRKPSTFPYSKNWVIEVSDAAGRKTSQPTSVTIHSGAVPLPTTPLSIDRRTQLLPKGRIGQEYEEVLGASGGVSPHVWKTVLGKLPLGLTLDTNLGRIHGLTAEAGIFKFDAMVEHTAGEFEYNGKRYPWSGGADKRSFELEILGKLEHALYLPVGRVGQPYAAAVLTTERLPSERIIWDGAMKDLKQSDDGLLKGLPSMPFTNALAYRIETGTNVLGRGGGTLVVLPKAPAMEVGGVVLQAWAGEVTRLKIPYRGMDEPAVITNVSALPPSLSIRGDELVGSPAKAGLTSVQLKAVDAQGKQVFGEVSIRISPPRTKPTFLDQRIIELVVGKPILWQPSIIGGDGVYQSELRGNLPSNLVYTNNFLSGQLSSRGSWPVVCVVRDMITGYTNVDSFTLHGIYLDETTPKLLSLRVPSAIVGVPYDFAFSSSGGIGTLGYEFSGRLPDGIQFTNGGISGRALVSGIFDFEVRVVDEVGQSDIARRFLLTATTNKPRISTVALPTAILGDQFDFTFSTVGGVGDVQLSLSGRLPDALQFTQTGLSGVAKSIGIFEVEASATDSIGQKEGPKRYKLVVEAMDRTKPRLLQTAIPAAIVGQPFDFHFPISGGIGTVRVEVVSTNLLNGLRITADGVNGVPTRRGSSVLDVTAFDSIGQRDGPRRFTLNSELIDQRRPSVVTEGLAPAFAGQEYMITFAAEGGIGQYTWNLQGQLPPGLRFTRRGIQGTLDSNAAPGTRRIQVSVRDESGQNSATNTFVLELRRLTPR